MRGAKEHGFYTEESDGVLLDKVKFFWNADYGHLSFTSDHSLVKNCDGYGSGDAVIYPGAAPQTGEFRDETFYPEQRFNTTIKKCDLHGSSMGYSGSMGNSVRVTKNNFYGNANGLTTDTLSAPGHPGFPADGMKVDHNMFYSNNLNVYGDDSPVVPLVPQAVGTGIMWPGMNDGEFSDNHVFDNWQHGTFLIGIPDAIAGTAEGNVDSQNHCDAPRLGPLLDVVLERVPRQRHGRGARAALRLIPASRCSATAAAWCRTTHDGVTRTTPTTRRASSRTESTSGGTRRIPRRKTVGSTTRATTARGIR